MIIISRLQEFKLMHSNKTYNLYVIIIGTSFNGNIINTAFYSGQFYSLLNVDKVLNCRYRVKCHFVNNVIIMLVMNYLSKMCYAVEK